MLISELFYGLWLMLKFKMGGNDGMRYPLTYRGRWRHTFHRERDRAEAALFNQIKHSPLSPFLEKQKKNFVLVAMLDNDWLWVNVYLLDESDHPGPANQSVYNERRGDDGTFNFIVRDGKLLKSRPCKGLSYVPGAQLLSWRGRIGVNEKIYLESLMEADQPYPKIKEL